MRTFLGISIDNQMMMGPNAELLQLGSHQLGSHQHKIVIHFLELRIEDLFTSGYSL